MSLSDQLDNRLFAELRLQAKAAKERLTTEDTATITISNANGDNFSCDITRPQFDRCVYR